MELFSQRHGFKPKKSVIQMNDMDGDLRNSIWNAMQIHYWSRGRDDYTLDVQEIERDLVRKLWLNYFKMLLDTMPGTWLGAKQEIRNYFFRCPWFEVYDFIEFVAKNYKYSSLNEQFRDYCNVILERELSGYRFVGEKITPITSEEEIAEIEKALKGTAFFEPVIIHLKTALNFFSDRKSPDYRNSIKESISAVEAMCNLLTGERHLTLAEALKVIMRKQKIKIHPSLLQSFINLYGYTSDAEGIRHALLAESNLDFEDAKFMLVSCSSFINYLKMKASKAGIDLESKQAPNPQ